MTASDFTVPMVGQVTVNWSVGVDEHGWVNGFIGTPEVVGELFDSDGTVLAVEEDIAHYSDAALLKGIQATAVDALNRTILPKIIPPMFLAMKEQRERQGGYRPKEKPEESEAEDAG